MSFLRVTGSAEEIAGAIRNYDAGGNNTMIFDERHPSSTGTLERREGMAKDVFLRVYAAGLQSYSNCRRQTMVVFQITQNSRLTPWV